MGLRFGLASERRMGSGLMAFAFQRLGDGLGPRWIGLFVMAALAFVISALCAFARPFRGLSFLGRRQLHACASRFGKADGNRLLGRAGAMFSLADVFDCFLDEFAGLCRG